MKYVLLIHQGSTPTPLDPEAWAALSADEQQEIYAVGTDRARCYALAGRGLSCA